MKNPSHKTNRATPRNSRRGESGQAFLEFFFVSMMLMVMLFGLIDFGRFLYEHEVMVNLSREGSNLASRGTSLSNTLAAVAADSSVNLSSSQGLIIVTAVNFNTNSPGTFFISQQMQQGLLSGPGIVSRIGTGVGTNSIAKVPPIPQAAPLPGTSGYPAIPGTNQTLYVTEVFHQFIPITPIGKLLAFQFPGFQLPSQEYDVAYFVGP